MIDSEIAAYLASAGFGTVGTDIFHARLPDQPDSCMAVYQTPGRVSVKTMSQGAGAAEVERPRFQVLVRASGYTSAYTKTYSAYKALDGLGSQMISGVEWLDIEALGPPNLLRRDSQERTEVICNFQAIKRLS